MHECVCIYYNGMCVLCQYMCMGIIITAIITCHYNRDSRTNSPSFWCDVLGRTADPWRSASTSNTVLKLKHSKNHTEDIIGMQPVQYLHYVIDYAAVIASYIASYKHRVCQKVHAEAIPTQSSNIYSGKTWQSCLCSWRHCAWLWLCMRKFIPLQGPVPSPIEAINYYHG